MIINNNEIKISPVIFDVFFNNVVELLVTGSSLISPPLANYTMNFNQYGSLSPPVRPTRVYPSMVYWEPAYNAPMSPYYPVPMSPQTFTHYATDRTMVSWGFLKKRL